MGLQRRVSSSSVSFWELLPGEWADEAVLELCVWVHVVLNWSEEAARAFWITALLVEYQDVVPQELSVSQSAVSVKKANSCCVGEKNKQTTLMLCSCIVFCLKTWERVFPFSLQPAVLLVCIAVLHTSLWDTQCEKAFIRCAAKASSQKPLPFQFAEWKVLEVIWERPCDQVQMPEDLRGPRCPCWSTAWRTHLYTGPLHF